MKSVQGFLCVQTTYINSLNTYAEVNAASQNIVEHLILTKVGMKVRVRIWGESSVEVILRKMKQFQDREVVRPLHPSEITDDIRERALGYLIFLNKKKKGAIKDRGCADRRPQRLYKAKEETCSPTVSTEVIFITSLIDTQECRDVAHADIPCAFLQTKASDDTSIKLEGAIMGVMLKLNPSWSQYVTYEGLKKIPTIYKNAIKALYGTVDAAKLFYDNLSVVLIDELGLERNPYDAYVVDKNINTKQCPIIWHVDDLKITRRSKDGDIHH